MKLTATREDILAPLQSVIGVVERRQTMPVLANVLLAARENRLSVTGTDLEVELVATNTANVQQAGQEAAGYFPLAAGKDERDDLDRGRARLDPRGPQPLHAVVASGRGIPAGRGDQRAADPHPCAG